MPFSRLFKLLNGSASLLVWYKKAGPIRWKPSGKSWQMFSPVLPEGERAVSGRQLQLFRSAFNPFVFNGEGPI